MLEILLNEKNISGVWVVIGAVLAFLGVISNNFFENRRRRKERQHALIREAYLGGVEYISLYIQSIASMAATSNFEFDRSMGSATDKYYKLFLIASADVIDAFAKFSQKSTRLVFGLSMTAIKFKKCVADVDQHQKDYENALKTMASINESREEYNNKRLNNKPLWELYEQQYQVALRDFDVAIKQHGAANSARFETHILLLKECIQALLDIFDDMYEAIISMRSDLDRKLSGHESKKIRCSISVTLEEFRSSVEQYIHQLEQEIAKLQDED